MEISEVVIDTSVLVGLIDNQDTWHDAAWALRNSFKKLTKKKRIKAMRSTTVEKDIHEQLGRLAIEQKRQVLEFARSLATARVHGVPGKDLLRFVGAIDHEDLMTIEQTIKEGCETVDLNKNL